MADCKCQFPDGAKISIGNREIDPCQFKLSEIHKNVTVEIITCPKCGHVSIGWYRQPNTEDVYMEEETND